ncbi:DUF2062 domain-containing protein [Caldichromatium japonicum]|uniref:DUF2062 domain-containing protein n=1 Tax=Caldichromatium japonicum TaxID=2699430 RepID=A0A6G7VDS5_9GAMM|nr:DUF2062 domain-containing protein [Caldichromatium japonicum]QIK38060.1 DUF2062 domain-containing protein [Caldichromatium japonicum]
MRKWLKQWTPTPAQIHGNRFLRIFGGLLHDPNLWHLNRRSVANAVAVGLFVMYLPPIGHTPIAAALAIWLRINLPIAVALVWISNPLTMPPMYYLAYLIGCWTLGLQSQGFDPGFWLDWHHWLEILEPMLVGCLICSTLCALAGYTAVRLLWRYWVVLQFRRRQARYRALFDQLDKTPSSSRQI